MAGFLPVEAEERGGGLDKALLRAELLQALEESRAALHSDVELLLERQHQVLCVAVERICGGSRPSGSTAAGSEVAGSAALGQAACCGGADFEGQQLHAAAAAQEGRPEEATPPSRPIAEEASASRTQPAGALQAPGEAGTEDLPVDAMQLPGAAVVEALPVEGAAALDWSAKEASLEGSTTEFRQMETSPKKDSLADKPAVEEGQPEEAALPPKPLAEEGAANQGWSADALPVPGSAAVEAPPVEGASALGWATKNVSPEGSMQSMEFQPKGDSLAGKPAIEDALPRDAALASGAPAVEAAEHAPAPEPAAGERQPEDLVSSPEAAQGVQASGTVPAPGSAAHQSSPEEVVLVLEAVAHASETAVSAALLEEAAPASDSAAREALAEGAVPVADPPAEEGTEKEVQSAEDGAAAGCAVEERGPAVAPWREGGALVGRAAEAGEELAASRAEDSAAVGSAEERQPVVAGHKSFSTSASGRFQSFKRQFIANNDCSTAFIDAVMGTSHDHFLQSLVPGSLRWRLEKVLTAQFDVAIGIVIVLNTAAMFVQLELRGLEADSIFAGDPAVKAGSVDRAFQALSHVFNALFTLELLLRLYVYRCFFFRSAFNVFDLSLVVVSLADAYVLPLILQRSTNLVFVRMLRFLRQGRTLRVIRTMGVFRQLRVLVNTIAVSLGSLAWSMLTLFLFMLMGALLLCQVSQDFINDGTLDPAVRAWVGRYYGTSFRALYTMFEATFSGGWPNYARTLIEDVSSLYAIFFMLYVTTVVFGMVRIISAIFLRDTLQVASKDADMIIHEKMAEAQTVREHLQDLFQEADKSGDGLLDWDEFFQILSNPRVKAWVSSLGLAVEDTYVLFEILDDGSGQIDWETFCVGILRLRGSVRPQDILRIERDCQRILLQCTGMREALSITVQHPPLAPTAP